jgi:hypothetical protein
MKRIFQSLIAIAFSLLLLNACKSGNTPEVKSTPAHIKHTPEWMKKEPIVMAGNWDSAPIFRTRKGGYQTWDVEDYPRTHSEETIIRLKEMGVTMAMIHFFKGFGLEAEKQQLEDAKKLAALCKKHGLRVGAYIGSTVAYETFLPEVPEAQSWFVPDYMGQPVTYGGQTYRKRVYFMHSGYRAYIKKVLRIAIEDLHVDLIHFDNTSMRGAIPIFFHPVAVEDFRTYLQKNYSPEQLKERLGFSNVSFVEPPKYSGNLSTMTDPLFQLWTDFRCKQLTGFYNEMAEYIQGLNPEVAVENNPSSGFSGRNTMWEQSVDYPQLLSLTNAVWTEEGNEASYTGDERLISKIRSYKVAGLFNNTVFTYTGDSKLKMAESMAYNRQCLGMVGGLLTGFELSETRSDRGFDNPYTEGTARETIADMKNKADYVRFFNSNFKYFRDVENIADVAVLRTFASMAFDNDRPYQSTYLFEQVFIQERIPFDIVFDENLTDLSKYRVLVLADQECLSDKNLALITDFVKKGGGLVVTEHSSLYNERFARRKNFGLKDLIQIEAPVWRGYNNEEILTMAPKNININGGRVVYLPEIKPERSKPSGAAMTSQYWKLPINEKEIVESVRWAAGNKLSSEIKAPEFVTAELKQRQDKSGLMLHLVNYNSEKEVLVKNIEVNLGIPAGKKPGRINIFSPDSIESRPLEYKVSQDRIIFTVPQLQTYDLVVIELD